MAENQHPEITADAATPETAIPKSGSHVIPPVETPPPEGALTESPELTSTMSVELTTARRLWKRWKVKRELQS